MTGITLKGRIIGFENYENYVMQNTFGEDSPYRLLQCTDMEVVFVVVNPFSVTTDYSFEIDDGVLESLGLEGKDFEDIAVLCVVRKDESKLYANLRSPLIVNTKQGIFRQVVLQNEAYGVSVPFAVKKAGE